MSYSYIGNTPSGGDSSGICNGNFSKLSLNLFPCGQDVPVNSHVATHMLGILLTLQRQQEAEFYSSQPPPVTC